METEKVVESTPEADLQPVAPAEYTSEIFKVEIKNLPRNFGFGALKKFIASLDLKVVKVKSPGQGSTFAFVTFTCEEERQKALRILNEATLKGRKLYACVSKEQNKIYL